MRAWSRISWEISTGQLCRAETFGLGTVYKLTPSGTETVLHSFAGGSDGATPYGGVILDRKGNLYGTTTDGGSSNAGIVFKVSPSGTETVLYTFAGGRTGPTRLSVWSAIKSATFMARPTRAVTVTIPATALCLRSRRQARIPCSTPSPAVRTGRYPDADLILDKQGNLYGTTIGGGIGFGVVYKVTP